MRNLLRFLPFVAMIVFACTADPNESTTEDDDLLTSQANSCIDDDPVTRVVNNGTVAFSLLVASGNGSALVDIPNIPPDTTTSWASFPEGEVIFYLNTEEASIDDKVTLQMNSCMAYEIEIDANNEIVSYTPTTL
ncbi:MAG: hypothetical protein AAFX55_15755 [Bacteroidota bacterium]